MKCLKQRKYNQNTKKSNNNTNTIKQIFKRHDKNDISQEIPYVVRE